MKIQTYHNIGCLGFIFVFGASFRNWKFILGRDCSEYQNRKNFDIQKIVMTHITWVMCMSHQSYDFNLLGSKITLHEFALPRDYNHFDR